MWLLFACVDRALFHRTRPGGTFVSASLTSNFQQASAVLPTDTTAPCSRVCPVVWQHSVFSCHNFLSHRVYDIILSIVSDFGVKHVTLRVPGQVCGQLVTCKLVWRDDQADNVRPHDQCTSHFERSVSLCSSCWHGAVAAQNTGAVLCVALSTSHSHQPIVYCPSNSHHLHRLAGLMPLTSYSLFAHPLTHHWNRCQTIFNKL